MKSIYSIPGFALGLFSCIALVGMGFPQAKAGPDLVRGVAAIISDQKPFSGKADAQIKVVGFVDYQCPACRAYFGRVEERMAHNPNVAFYVEQFPLTRQHPLALPAATLAVNAQAKGVFGAVHEELLQGTELKQTTLDSISKKFGIGAKPTPETSALLAREQKAELAIGVSMVPSFLVSDAKGVKAYGWKDVLARFP